MDNIDKFIETCESLIIDEVDISMESTVGGIFILSLIAFSIGISIQDHKKYKVRQAGLRKNSRKREEENKNRKQTEIEIKTQFSQVYADTKKIVNVLKRDKGVESKINNALKNSELVEGLSKKDLEYELLSKIFEQSDTEMIIEIIDAEQMVRTEMSFILDNITEILQVKYPKLNFNTGDGDEGCIYVKGYLEE